MALYHLGKLARIKSRALEWIKLTYGPFIGVYGSKLGVYGRKLPHTQSFDVLVVLGHYNAHRKVLGWIPWLRK